MRYCAKAIALLGNWRTRCAHRGGAARPAEVTRQRLAQPRRFRTGPRLEGDTGGAAGLRPQSMTMNVRALMTMEM